MLLPPLGTVSAYTFTTEFASLNGIYTLTEILTYNQAIANGVDFIKSLYTPAGVAAAQFITDAVNYTNNNVLLLTPANVKNGIPIYAPVSILAMQPDSMVGCYNKIAIGINLGLFNDQTKLTWIINEINQILTATLGINNPAVLYSLGSEYMKISDFNTQQAQRQAAITGYNTLYTQLLEQTQLTKEAQNLVQYYQNTLIALATA